MQPVGRLADAAAAGRCERLLELLEYLCSNEDDNAAALYQWVLRWLAYRSRTPAPR